jgi:hypothetical protein
MVYRTKGLDRLKNCETFYANVSSLMNAKQSDGAIRLYESCKFRRYNPPQNQFLDTLHKPE